METKPQKIYFLVTQTDLQKISELQQAYGHDPFCHDLRNLELLSDIEQYMESYLPDVSHLKYLLEDLKNVITELNNFFMVASVNNFYLMRNTAQFLLSPHVLITSKMQDLGSTGDPYNKYLSLFAVANNLLHEILNATSPQEISGYFADIGDFIARIAEAALTPFEKVGQAVKDSKDAAQTVIDSAATTVSTLAGVVAGLAKIIPWVLFATLGIMVYRRIAPQVNPQNNKENLYQYANRLKNIDRQTFYQALDNFWSQHHRLPERSEIKLVGSPPGFTAPVVVEVGGVKDIVYHPPEGSRKAPYRYRHNMDETKLVSDPTGKSLMLVGPTYLDRRDGWLKQ